MEYYNVVKKGYIVESNIEKERHLKWLESCEKQKVIPIPSYVKI